jgi:Flp pilus assembly pilin Flp
MLQRLLSDEDGQDIIEYGLLATLISVIAILVIVEIGPLVIALYQTVVDALS